MYHVSLHMHNLRLVVVVALSAIPITRCWGEGEVFLPYERGSHATDHVFINSYVTLGLEEHLDVWLPTDPGTYHIFYYLDGFGGIIPAGAYNKTMDHIASHGIVVVALWKMTLPFNPDDKVPIFASVLEWAEQHLEDKLHNEGISDTVHLNMENLVVGGHSAGCHILVEYLKGTCGKFKGQVLMSPVDGGVDSDTLQPVFCITPGQALNYNTPTLHLAADLDPIPGGNGTMACGPAKLSNDRFYDALDPQSQRWSINATEYGHGDFLDPIYEEVIQIMNFCSYNEAATAEDFDTYRRFSAGQIVTFIRALFTEGECAEYLAYLEVSAVMPVATVERHNNPPRGCPVAGCTWTPEPVITAAP